MVRTGPRKPAVSDSAILAKLDECGGHISRTAKELRIRKARVVAVNRNHRNSAANKKETVASDAAILAKVDECGGHLSRAANELGIRKARVIAVNRAFGNPAKDTRERTEIEAAEELVIRLCAIIETLTIGDGKIALELARAMGKAVDRLVVLVDRAEARRTQAPAVTLIDLFQISRADLLEAIRKHDEKNGTTSYGDGSNPGQVLSREAASPAEAGAL